MINKNSLNLLVTVAFLSSPTGGHSVCDSFRDFFNEPQEILKTKINQGDLDAYREYDQKFSASSLNAEVNGSKTNWRLTAVGSPVHLDAIVGWWKSYPESSGSLEGLEALYRFQQLSTRHSAHTPLAEVLIKQNRFQEAQDILNEVQGNLKSVEMISLEYTIQVGLQKNNDKIEKNQDQEDWQVALSKMLERARKTSNDMRVIGDFYKHKQKNAAALVMYSMAWGLSDKNEDIDKYQKLMDACNRALGWGQPAPEVPISEDPVAPVEEKK